MRTPVSELNVEPGGKPEAERMMGSGGRFKSVAMTANEKMAPA